MTTTWQRSTLSDIDLNQLHKSELSQALGDRALLDATRETHRLEWVQRVDGRPRVTEEDRPVAKAPPVEAESHKNVSVKRTFVRTPTKAPEPVQEAPKVNLCRDCKAEIPPTGKKGRPPVRCASCKEALDTEAPAVKKPRGWNLKKKVVKS